MEVVQIDLSKFPAYDIENDMQEAEINIKEYLKNY